MSTTQRITEWLQQQQHEEAALLSLISRILPTHLIASFLEAVGLAAAAAQKLFSLAVYHEADVFIVLVRHNYGSRFDVLIMC